jgi:hypothetical protein
VAVAVERGKWCSSKTKSKLGFSNAKMLHAAVMREREADAGVSTRPRSELGARMVQAEPGTHPGCPVPAEELPVVMQSPVHDTMVVGPGPSRPHTAASVGAAAVVL